MPLPMEAIMGRLFFLSSVGALALVLAPISVNVQNLDIDYVIAEAKGGNGGGNGGGGNGGGGGGDGGDGGDGGGGDGGGGDGGGGDGGGGDGGGVPATTGFGVAVAILGLMGAGAWFLRRRGA
jgi:hypothetical protein